MADGLSSPTTQNIYYLSQKLNELQLKEAKLQQKLAMNKLKQQIRRVDGIMSLNLQAESETLQTTCTITENLTKLEKIISGNKNIIPVTREKHREVQQLLAASTNILNQTASNINNEECSNLNLNTSLENIKTLTTKYEKTNTALDNYMQLYKMINCIISIGKSSSGNWCLVNLKL